MSIVKLDLYKNHASISKVLDLLAEIPQEERIRFIKDFKAKLKKYLEEN